MLKKKENPKSLSDRFHAARISLDADLSGAIAEKIHTYFSATPVDLPGFFVPKTADDYDQVWVGVEFRHTGICDHQCKLFSKPRGLDIETGLTIGCCVRSDLAFGAGMLGAIATGVVNINSMPLLAGFERPKAHRIPQD